MQALRAFSRRIGRTWLVIKLWNPEDHESRSSLVIFLSSYVEKYNQPRKGIKKYGLCSSKSPPLTMTFWWNYRCFPSIRLSGWMCMCIRHGQKASPCKAKLPAVALERKVWRRIMKLGPWSTGKNTWLVTSTMLRRWDGSCLGILSPVFAAMEPQSGE